MFTPPTSNPSNYVHGTRFVDQFLHLSLLTLIRGLELHSEYTIFNIRDCETPLFLCIILLFLWVFQL